MVLVNCVWRQDDVIDEIEAIEIKGEKIFKHVRTKGMRIYFDSKLAGHKELITIEYFLIWDAIMRIPGASALAFSILPVINGSNFEGYRYTVCKPYDPDEPNYVKLLSGPKGESNLQRLLK